MSAGHGHTRPNLRHAGELRKLLQSGGAPELMKRWQKLNADNDVTYLAGYNTDGTVRYIDRDVLHALLDPKYAEHLGIGAIDTGLSPEDTIDCLMEHEAIEKALLDSDGDITTYQGAHELATSGEHEMVRSKGGKPHQYERGLAKAIAWCAKKTLHKVPQDFDCAPLLDHPDDTSRRALAAMIGMNVADATKASKESVGYSKSNGKDQCVGCAHWQAERTEDLSPCEVTQGLVRNSRWCEEYRAAEEDTDDGETDQRTPGHAPEERVRNAGRAQVPDARSQRPERQGPGNAAGKEGSDFAQYGRQDQGQGEPQAG